MNRGQMNCGQMNRGQMTTDTRRPRAWMAPARRAGLKAP